LETLRQPEEHRKIVLFCLSPLGDTLFATPAIRALKENFPGARIVVLASPSASEVLKRNPYQIQVIRCSDQWQFWRTMADIRRDNFDLAVSFTQFGSIFTKLCAADRYGDFYSIDNPRQRPVVQLCLDILGQLGLKTGPARTEFWFDETDRIKVRAFLEGAGWKGQRPLVAVHCGGHYFPRKRWPAASFASLIQQLRRLGVKVVLVGGTEDRETADLIGSMVPDALSAVGKLRLTETAALLDQCRLFIGNDSGPLHLAAAVDTPTIGLFGPTAPDQFYPYHPPDHRYIYQRYPCSPCYQFGGGLWQFVPKCSRAYCMEAITVAEVMESVEAQLYPEWPLAVK
jgi:ADP-heptose:LPS heptosyltransferase